jgi:outer membrane protein OmpA-like peptidoglycan-associated protein
MPEKVNIELSVESAQAVRAWLANNQGIVMNTMP